MRVGSDVNKSFLVPNKWEKSGWRYVAEDPSVKNHA